jgi:hypothetical protein
MNDVIVNKVAESGLMEINLEDYYPKDAIAVFDLKDHLFMGLIIKEKEFRETLKNLDWGVYEGKIVAVTCSADAIIPMWAYMLIATYLQPLAKRIIFGTPEFALQQVFLEQIRTIDAQDYFDKRVVVKGCGELPVGPNAYMEITLMLRAVAKSIMYGEPCSTVPIFKKKV